MEINGKVYRNLEGQVEYLTGKWDDLQNQINDVRSHLTHYVIVDSLPTEDIDTSAVYLVGPMGTAPDTYYEEWVYVQLADESWTWEKLGDTDSVDLSGYLQKVTSATTERQVYAKATDGTQTMLDAAQNAVGGAIPIRSSAGHILVPDSPNNGSFATNKNYVDGNFVAKQTGTTTYPQLYGKYTSGNQAMFNLSDGANANTVALRDADGKVLTKDPVNSSDAVNLSYANTNYLAKQTGTTTYRQAYCKTAAGTQEMVNVRFDAAEGYSVGMRTSNGQMIVASPTADNHAATKKYVDDSVGQLLYLHDIELTITVDASNKLYVKAYLVNGSATAITSFDRQLYKRIDVQYGAFGPDMANVEAVAVSKLPDTFRQDEFDEPFVGFLYQYISGGNLISGKTDSNMSTTITDTVISF